jgi:PIN domain nuclease of toxin-antitoxin system
VRPVNSLLLDTCALIWISQSAPLRHEAQEALAQAQAAKAPVAISLISAWEIAQLVAKNRVALTLSPGVWFQRVRAQPGVKTTDLTDTILINSHFLPGTPPSDPMDRIIISSAREHGLTIMTRDRKILDYADQGHVSAIAC